MIHGVYVKNRPTHLWKLVSVSASAEVILHDKEVVLQEAINNGNPEAQAAIKSFDSIWFLPNTLKEIDEDIKLLYS